MIAYRHRIQNSGIRFFHGWESISLKGQKSMHIPNMNKVLLVTRGFAKGMVPFLDQLQNSILNWGRDGEGSFWESTNERVEKLFGGDLEVEWVSTVFDTVVKKLTVITTISKKKKMVHCWLVS